MGRRDHVEWQGEEMGDAGHVEMEHLKGKWNETEEACKELENNREECQECWKGGWEIIESEEGQME